MLSPRDLNRKLNALLTEARAIAAERKNCHLTANDLMAIELLNRVHQEEPLEDLAMIEACLERMRIARATGKYPRHLISRTKPTEGLR